VSSETGWQYLAERSATPEVDYSTDNGIEPEPVKQKRSPSYKPKSTPSTPRKSPRKQATPAPDTPLNINSTPLKQSPSISLPASELPKPQVERRATRSTTAAQAKVNNPDDEVVVEIPVSSKKPRKKAQ